MPTYPATGYGYIQAGQPVSPVAFHEHFKEKPNIETAKSFLRMALLSGIVVYSFGLCKQY